MVTDHRNRWWEHIPWSPIFLLIMQTIAVTAIIVQMRSEISTLSSYTAAADRRLESYDTVGTRQLAVTNQRIAAYGELQKLTDERLHRLSSRMDDFINQVNRLDTPLSKKVEAMDTTLGAIRDANNALHVRAISIDGHIASVRENTRRLEERVDKVVQVMDAMYALLNDHLRVPHVSQPAKPIIPRAPRKAADD